MQNTVYNTFFPLNLIFVVDFEGLLALNHVESLQRARLQMALSNRLLIQSTKHLVAPLETMNPALTNKLVLAANAEEQVTIPKATEHPIACCSNRASTQAGHAGRRFPGPPRVDTTAPVRDIEDSVSAGRLCGSCCCAGCPQVCTDLEHGACTVQLKQVLAPRASARAECSGRMMFSRSGLTLVVPT